MSAIHPAPVTRHEPENAPMSSATAAMGAGLVLLFGANTVAIKLSLAGLGPLTAAGIRFTVSAMAIAAWARLTHRPLALKPGQWPQVAITTTLFCFQLACFYLGLSRSHASRGALLANLQPFFVLLLAHFFISNDRMRMKTVIGMLLALAGIIALFGEHRNLSADLQIGDWMIFTGTLVWAANVIFIKRIIHGFRSYQLVWYPMLVAAPAFLIIGLLTDAPPVGPVTPTVVGAMAYQSLVTASFGFVAWNELLRRHGAVALHSFLFIMPVAGVALGHLILGEPITGPILWAMGLIATGLVIVHFKTNPR